VLDKQGLQKPAAFVHKILQLHETLGVRFGAMLVGQAGTGKSTLLRTLQVRLLSCCCLAHLHHRPEGHRRQTDPLGHQESLWHLVWCQFPNSSCGMLSHRCVPLLLMPPGDCSAVQIASCTWRLNIAVLSVPLPLQDSHLCLSCHAAGCNRLSA